MAKLILLPGNGAHNREWIENVQREIDGEVLYYKHWGTGEAMIDFEHEADVLRSMVDEGPIRVFAKSAGCLLAMKAAREYGVLIEKAVFVGTAVNWGVDLGMPVREWLEAWAVPTLFVQKSHDKVISANELREIVGDAFVLEIEGDDHDYMELDQFILDVRQHLNVR